MEADVYMYIDVMNGCITLYAWFDVTVVNPIPDCMLFSGILVEILISS